MPILNYAIVATSGSSVVGMGVRLVVYGNYSGASLARIYLDGESAPAFFPMSSVGGGQRLYDLLTNIGGIYCVEYKDNNGEVLLAKIQINESIGSTCYDEFDEGQFQTTVRVIDTGVSVTHFPGVWTGHTVTEAQSAAQRKFTIDGGTTYKPALYFESSTSGRNTWSNSELDSLGIGATVDISVVRNSNDCTEILATLVNLFRVEVLDPLTATYNKTNSTAAGADDGTITVIPAGGSGEYEYAWEDGPTTQNRSGLAPGVYTVVITDLETDEEVTLEGIQITEPSIVPPPEAEGSILEFPMLNPFRWVVNAVSDPDNVTTFQTPDNTLFCKEYYRGYEGSLDYWAQRVMTADLPNNQFISDFQFHLIELRSLRDGEVIKTIPAVLKEQNIGITEDFPIRIQNHTEVNQSRVYFQQGILPVPLTTGEGFEIKNNADGFNGLFNIVAIEVDVSLGTQYLVINRVYDIPDPYTTADGEFDVSIVDFNVYEFITDFSDVPPGNYYMTCVAYNSDVNFKEAVTEPIDLKLNHRDCVLIEYRNVDNSNDVTWTTGFIGQIRVPIIHGIHRKPGGEFSTSRDSDFSLVMNAARMIRGFKLPIIQVPPYMHEKLAVIFKTDFWFINKVRYQSLSAYSEPSYIDGGRLASSDIEIEQIAWFKNYNSNDLGTIADGGFLLLGQGGYLKI